MKERLKELRKALGLTQSEFGTRIGASRDAIAAYERGVTIKEPIIKIICIKYNVNYYWLTKGEGDMFERFPSTTIDQLVLDYGLNDIDRLIVLRYLELPPDKREAISYYLKSIFLDKNELQ